MSWTSLDAILLDLVASFATAIANPVVWLLVLAATAGRRRVWAARVAAVSIGIAIGLLDLVLEITDRDRLPMLAGNAAAAALLGELVLQVVMPLWRFSLRCAAFALALIRRIFSAGPD